jgi:replicative DNA helicase
LVPNNPNINRSLETAANVVLSSHHLAQLTVTGSDASSAVYSNLDATIWLAVSVEPRSEAVVRDDTGYLEIQHQAAVIGAMLFHPHKAPELWEHAQHYASWDPLYSAAAQSLGSIIESGSDLDLWSFGMAMGDAGATKQIPHVVHMSGRSPCFLQALGHAKALRRRQAAYTLGFALGAVGSRLTSGETPEELGAEIRETMDRFAEPAEEELFEPISAVVDRHRAYLHDVQEGLVDRPYVSSAFAGINAKISGYRKGHWSVIAARPKVGKSTIAEQEEYYTAAKKRWVLKVTLEMDPAIHLERMALRESGCGLTSGELWSAWKKCSQSKMAERIKKNGDYQDALFRIRDLPIVMVRSTKRRKLSEVLRSMDAACEWMPEEPALVVVDYVQLAEDDDEKGREDQRIARVVRGLTQWIDGRDSAGILIAQLNRSYEREPDRLPRASDLRECGQLEQDAAAIAFLDRPEKMKEGAREIEPCRMVISDARFGESGIIDLQWRGSALRFESPNNYDGII